MLAEKGSYLGNSQDDRAFIPLTTMTHEIVGRTSPYGIELTFISVTAQNTEKIQAAQFQIENLLRLRHHITGEDDFTVEVPNEMIAIVRTVSLGLTLMLSALAGISLVVGGIGVMNMMLVSVTERTPEVGLRKALGARHQDILTQFLIESVILCATGGLLGTLAGIGVICIFGLVTPLPIVISPLVIVINVTFSGLMGVLFGVLPAQQAAKLNPTVALRRV
jgi:putative ABC transport system permease protein